MRRMSSHGFAAAVLLAYFLTLVAAQKSCKERCGSEYYRGYMCQCDYSCLRYGECCKDFESQCTTKDSCKGRCGESFRRGQTCSCDSDCVKYNQCCPDYKVHCDEEDATPQPVSEGNDPGDSFIPTVNPTSYPQDDPDSDAKQIFHNGEEGGPDPSSPPESASGFGPTSLDVLEDITTAPPLPDLDGFEILPEPVTDRPETHTTTAAETHTTELTTDRTVTLPVTLRPEESTTPSEEETTYTVAVEPRTAVTEPPSQPPPEPTSISTDPQALETGTTEPNVLSSEIPEMTSLTPENTALPERTEESTTPTHLLLTTPENVEPVTTVTSTTNGETTSIPQMTTTDSTNPSTLAPEEVSSDVITTNTELETTMAQETETTQSPTSPPRVTSKPEEPLTVKPDPNPDNRPVLNGLGVDDPREFQADDSNDTNLCSGRPISGLTTLSNGTVVVFRGHFFWILDRNRVAGPAQRITEVWGIPSPIDTVFTRCNCQGKTYIFKGPRYWRFENDALDPGYPKVIETGFDGLRGHITAALSVPQYNRRKESVYFFKRGGTVQKYSYQFGTNPSCGRKVNYAIYAHRNRIVRQVPAQVSLLGPTINIRTSWRGFPTTITAAVSVPNRNKPEGYNYYVFSRSKSYSIRMDGERPVVEAPKPNTSPQSNEVFKCAKKGSQPQ